MHALVPILVFARHHGLLFGLPFLRVVGFFNEHFDPTQVWRWCLRDPGEKIKRTEKKHSPFSVRDLLTVVSSVAATPGSHGPRLHPQTPSDRGEVAATYSRSSLDLQIANVH